MNGGNNQEITGGLDIATYHSAGDNVPLYSMCNGEVVLKSYDADGYGYYLIMKDSTTGMGFLYAHLKEPSPKNVGDSVSIGEFVGIEGTTGSSTRNSPSFRNARYKHSFLDIWRTKRSIYKPC